ncbi:hypothetical protein MHYP_G00325890 [Metynnis hypsauchen]
MCRLRCSVLQLVTAMQLYGLISCLTLLKLIALMLCRACRTAEYEVNGECCPMCSAGTGLRIQQDCRSSEDTVCEPQSGYYCVETRDKTCRRARQHSTCLPGQYINQTGTAFTDTVCKDCSEGSYSDGSFTFCKPHRKCESAGQITTTPGTKSSDSESEYEIDGECCAMCAPGNHVYRHCTVNISTTCVSCHDSTFIDAPNGLSDCFSCTVCDPGQGLRVKTPCTRSSNTVCEPLDGHYCTDQHRSSCILAQKHTNCSTGQYIKQKGTAFKDTECAECADGTYSDGSFQTCQPHSEFEDLRLKEIKAGTHSFDAECGNKASLIAAIIVSVIITVAVAVIVIMLRCGRLTCRKNKQKKEKSDILIKF